MVYLISHHENFARNAKGSIIQEFPKCIAIRLEMCELTLAIFSVHIEIEGALNLEPKKLRWKDNGKDN